MADLKLSDGREVTFDLNNVTHKEFAEFWDTGKKKTQAQRDAFFKKLCGLTEDEIEGFSEKDWRKFKKAFQKACFTPLEDDLKNSPSASTSPEEA